VAGGARDWGGAEKDTSAERAGVAGDKFHLRTAFIKLWSSGSALVVLLD
jgi:hypothetical protein